MTFFVLGLCAIFLVIASFLHDAYFAFQRRTEVTNTAETAARLVLGHLDNGGFSGLGNSGNCKNYASQVFDTNEPNLSPADWECQFDGGGMGSPAVVVVKVLTHSPANMVSGWYPGMSRFYRIAVTVRTVGH